MIRQTSDLQASHPVWSWSYSSVRALIDDKLFQFQWVCKPVTFDPQAATFAKATWKVRCPPRSIFSILFLRWAGLCYSCLANRPGFTTYAEILNFILCVGCVCGRLYTSSCVRVQTALHSISDWFVSRMSTWRHKLNLLMAWLPSQGGACWINWPRPTRLSDKAEWAFTKTAPSASTAP